MLRLCTVFGPYVDSIVTLTEVQHTQHGVVTLCC
jgi:hypothetical protein